MNSEKQRKYQKIDDSFLDESHIGFGESKMVQEINPSF